MAYFYDINAFTLKYDKGDGKTRNLCLMNEKGSLKFEEREVNSPTAKFAKEDAQKDPQKGFHLRCLYNNKYLVWEASTKWIIASASEKDEDESSTNCTLFKYIVTGDNRFKFTHVQTQRELTIEPPEDPVNGYYLGIDPISSAIRPEYIIIDVSRIIRLPKYVVFKGDNDKYLRQHPNVQYWREFQEFSGEDRFHKEAWYETFPTNNGDVRIKSVAAEKFLMWYSNYIKAISDGATSDEPATLFEIAKINDTTVALKSRTDNEFCKRFGVNDEDLGNCLIAAAESAVKEAQLLVEEPVLDRTVKIEYRLQDARIYDNQPKSWLSTEVSNTTPEAGSFSLETKYVESYSHSLHVSATVSTNITTKFSAGIPLVVQSEIEVEVGASIETGYEHTWDKTTEHVASVTADVPPGKKRAARMLSMVAKCDVPFSYVQTDILANNERVVTVLEDGVFKGLNGYQFVIEIFDPETNPSVALEKRYWKPIVLPEIVQGSLRKQLAGEQDSV